MGAAILLSVYSGLFFYAIRLHQDGELYQINLQMLQILALIPSPSP